MSLRAGIVVIGLLAAACGEKKPPSPVAPHPEEVDAGVVTAIDGGQPTPPSEAECGSLVTHILDLGMAQFRADAIATGKPIPTEPQIAKIRGDLTGELMQGCRKLSREVYLCAMAATNIAGYLACEKPTD